MDDQNTVHNRPFNLISTAPDKAWQTERLLLFGRPMAEQDVASLILNKFREQLPTNTDVVAAETMANG